MTTESDSSDTIAMPAPTAWPLVLALALTLLAMGLVTNLALTAVGAVLGIGAAVGWFRRVFLPEGTLQESLLPPERRAREVRPILGAVEPLREGMPGARMQVPEKVHPYSAGAKGGLIGGLVMPVPALLYGLVSGHGIWYPINLLAGMVMELPENVKDLETFRFGWLLLGTVLHGVTSVGLGLMYGVLLPMLPSRPIFWGGVVAPLLWTGAIYSFMGVLNPALHDAVDWPSFIASQFIYGVVVGVVVVRSEKVYVNR